MSNIRRSCIRWRSGHSLSASNASNGPLLRRSAQCRLERPRFVLKAAVSFVNTGCLRRSAQTDAGADFASPVLARRVQSYIGKEGSSGLGLHAITEQLQADALKAFTSSFGQLLATLAGEEAPDFHRRELTRTWWSSSPVERRHNR